MKSVTLTEDEFVTLLHGGFFALILSHPEVEVYRSRGSITVHVPGKGAVQVETSN